MIPGIRRAGVAGLLACLSLFHGGTASAQELRRELFNRSGQPWRLLQVAGTRDGVGRMRVIDKFTGRLVGSLDKVGASLTLPAGARYLMEFCFENRNFFLDCLVQDGAGCYAEYVVTVPFLAEPEPVFSYKDRHVGPPLDQATDEVVLRRIEDAISTADGNLTILQDFIRPQGYLLAGP
jgi:hypothetical protein